MNALHVLFRTGRFNLTEVKPHFINPCCFGEDLAAWLRSKLLERGAAALDPHQEDWGWEFRAGLQGHSYYIGVGGNSDDGTSDRGEWRIIVEKRHSLPDRLGGKGKIEADDPIVRTIEEILANEPDFQDIHRAEE